jgi:hypothetical protein
MSLLRVDEGTMPKREIFVKAHSLHYSGENRDLDARKVIPC